MQRASEQRPLDSSTHARTRRAQSKQKKLGCFNKASERHQHTGAEVRERERQRGHNESGVAWW